MRTVVGAVRHTYARADGRSTSVDALGPIDLDIDPGEFVAIVGPSGCGKSTLLSLLAGFITPTEGTVAVDGQPITGPDPRRGIVFQQPNLYPWYTVRENVALGPRLRGAKKAERHRIADDYISLVGLADFAGAKPYELSGGMQQRTQIARVLANDPQLMLLDEPFGALDAMTREHLQTELHRIWRGSGAAPVGSGDAPAGSSVGIDTRAAGSAHTASDTPLAPRKSAVFITHSVDEAVFLGTRVLVMSPRPGRIVFDERPDFGDDERDAALRGTPEFAAFSARVREQITESLVSAVA